MMQFYVKEKKEETRGGGSREFTPWGGGSREFTP